MSGKKSTEDHSNERPSYFLQQERYTGEMSIARQYAGQKVWPRAVYVRQARFYHSARLRWSAIERRRGPLEDILIDDLAEWSMWHYPSGEGGLDEVQGSGSHPIASIPIQFGNPVRRHWKRCLQYAREVSCSRLRC